MSEHRSAAVFVSTLVWPSLLAVACIGLTGCSVVRTLKHSMALQAAYHEPADSFLVAIRHRLMAGRALAQFEKLNPCLHPSRHFRAGFRAGFHDVLHGGDGRPPVLPPPRYWTVFYRRPAGHKAIQDWFDGFKAGAQWAIKRDYRRWEIVPTSGEQPADSEKTVQSYSASETTLPRHQPGKVRWRKLQEQEQRVAKLTSLWLGNSQKGHRAVLAAARKPRRPGASAIVLASAAQRAGQASPSSTADQSSDDALLFLPVATPSAEPAANRPGPSPPASSEAAVRGGQESGSAARPEQPQRPVHGLHVNSPSPSSTAKDDDAAKLSSRTATSAARR